MADLPFLNKLISDTKARVQQATQQAKPGASVSRDALPSVRDDHSGHDHSHGPALQQKRPIRLSQNTIPISLLEFEVNGNLFDFNQDGGIAMGFLKKRNTQTAWHLITLVVPWIESFGYPVEKSPEDIQKLSSYKLPTEPLTPQTEQSIKSALRQFMGALKKSVSTALDKAAKEKKNIADKETLLGWPTAILTIVGQAFQLVRNHFTQNDGEEQEAPEGTEVVEFNTFMTQFGSSAANNILFQEGRTNAQLTQAYAKLAQEKKPALAPVFRQNGTIAYTTQANATEIASFVKSNINEVNKTLGTTK